MLRDDQMTEQRYSFLSGLLSVASSSLLGEMVFGAGHTAQMKYPQLASFVQEDYNPIKNVRIDLFSFFSWPQLLSLPLLLHLSYVAKNIYI